MPGGTRKQDEAKRANAPRPLRQHWGVPRSDEAEIREVFAAHNLKQKAQRRERQQLVLEAIRNGVPPKEACRSLGYSPDAYYRWRSDDAGFFAEAEAAMAERRDGLGITRQIVGGSTVNTSIQFRKQFFGHGTSPGQLQIIKAVRECPPGQVVIVTIPPGGGKTTTMEDLVCEDIARNPNWRGAHVHASSTKSSQSLQKIKRRMEPSGPAKSFVASWGPFVPRQGTSKAWTAYEFTVDKATHDEKDPTFQAKSITSNIQGSRLNLMLVDDVQSRKSLGQTEGICDTLQQDFFTRDAADEAGMAIVIVNTRVGEHDVPSVLAKRLSETGALHRWIVVPAIDSYGESYDPDMWPVERLMQKKAVTTDEIWNLCYMQDPKSLKVKTFPWTLLDACKDNGRRWGETTLPRRVAGLDPALGGWNVLTVCAWGKDHFHPIFQQADHGLGRVEQILEIIKTAQARHHFTDLVIENNAFQRGLSHDERIVTWAANVGVEIHDHTTGWGKLDDTLGVGSMAGSLTQHEMSFPWADGESRSMFQPFLEELEAWRPDLKTKQRKQDRVMSIWFAWLFWQLHRSDLDVGDNDIWRFSALPHTPTAYQWTPGRSGLLIPH